MLNHNNLLRAIALAGSQKELASLVGVSDKTVSAWIVRGNIPAERCPAIEKATGGAVRCEDLRPDVDWAFIRGTKVA